MQTVHEHVYFWNHEGVELNTVEPFLTHTRWWTPQGMGYGSLYLQQVVV